MKTMNRGTICFSAIFMIGLMVMGSSHVSAAPATPPIKIGALIAYTGPDPLVTEIDKGIKLKLDEVGWKVGNRTIDLRTEDYAANAVTAVDKARKLVDLD